MSSTTQLKTFTWKKYVDNGTNVTPKTSREVQHQTIVSITVFSFFHQFGGVGKRGAQYQKWTEGARGGELLCVTFPPSGSSPVCNYAFEQGRNGQQGDAFKRW